MDTNILVRYLVNDDVDQSAAARALAVALNAEEPAFVCREVLVELVWVLERSYGFSRDAISTALLDMLATAGLILETSDDVARAAVSYRRGDADFSDLMITAASRRECAVPLYTFDQRAARLDGVRLLDA
ncbi:MAG: type II toxin-antitoxin system VapC family toxin [Gammaproteobacteria bacterium]|nr:type II toxin-antitoxin system VapC family toxin [Gammaproteobacteria bacterium]